MCHCSLIFVWRLLLAFFVVFHMLPITPLKGQQCIEGTETDHFKFFSIKVDKICFISSFDLNWSADKNNQLFQTELVICFP